MGPVQVLWDASRVTLLLYHKHQPIRGRYTIDGISWVFVEKEFPIVHTLPPIIMEVEKLPIWRQVTHLPGPDLSTSMIP